MFLRHQVKAIWVKTLELKLVIYFLFSPEWQCGRFGDMIWDTFQSDRCCWVEESWWLIWSRWQFPVLLKLRTGIAKTRFWKKSIAHLGIVVRTVYCSVVSSIYPVAYAAIKASLSKRCSCKIRLKRIHFFLHRPGRSKATKQRWHWDDHLTQQIGLAPQIRVCAIVSLTILPISILSVV